MRIASLVPSTTEIVAELGLGHQLVARTHECDHPGGLDTVPTVTTDLLPPGLTPAEIDDAVAASVHDRHTIYALDAAALRTAAPDVILTQATCAVCAVDVETVDAVACTMPHGARVVSFDPVRLVDIIDGMATVGTAVGAENEGLALRANLEERLRRVDASVAGRPRPRVAVVEWSDPLYAPGHWVPDMVEAAGGHSVYGDPGGRSVRTSLDELEASTPEVVIVALCGFNLEATLPLAAELTRSEVWRESSLASVPVVAFDGSAYFSRPGPRVVEGIETLSWILHTPHPDLRPGQGMAAIQREGDWISSDRLEAPITAVSSSHLA